MDPEIAFRATECLCKCCLHASDVNEWRKALLHLLLLSFSSETKDNPQNGKQKACLSRFMPIFAAISRQNQILLAEVMIDALDNLKERDMQLTAINVTALASYITNLTSLNILGPNAPDRKKGSAHSHLATLVLTALKNNADNYFASVYCKILSDLELNESMTIDDFNTLLFLCTDVCNESTTEKAKDIKHIQQFMKRLTYLKEKMGSMPPARPESVASSIEELRLTPSTPIQRAKPSRMASSKRRRISRAAKANHQFYNADDTIAEEDDEEEGLLEQ
uniref:Nuclear condensin complex subunit 3 C-terminal domain-containing protein n=1 Tax=Ditylenchus dipsaci TaxID=166011 RepID=A0A915EAQ7_9BILA